MNAILDAGAGSTNGLPNSIQMLKRFKKQCSSNKKGHIMLLIPARMKGVDETYVSILILPNYAAE
jgi:hypothetical protein